MDCNEKNKKLIEGHRTRHIGVRWDYAEWSYGPFGEVVKKGSARLVFPMRDLMDILMSQCFNNFLSANIAASLKKFQGNVSNSINKVIKYGDYACPVCIYNGDDWRRLLAWLDLKPNNLQESWIFNPPITNYTNRDREGYAKHKVNFPKDVKIPKELEDQYWSMLYNARNKYAKRSETCLS